MKLMMTRVLATVMVLGSVALAQGSLGSYSARAGPVVLRRFLQHAFGPQSWTNH
jgi:hypothetical protein